ncbi:MAG: hypothetical protein ABIR37_01630 [Candidatus Saccharimonadales bacterium]
MQHRILNFLQSRTFLLLIIGAFALQASWIALTGRYPGAFDENFHFGLIRMYAQHWSPFLDAQPPNAEVYGAVARDPSYLYHYLMSFPYRFIAVLTHSQTTQIIILRLINVAFATAGLLIYAKILRRTRLALSLQNVVVLLFVSIPIFPLLAGQINYDNLLLILVGLAVLWTLQFTEYIQKGILSGRLLGQIIVVCIVACLVKYAFLPLGLALLLFTGLTIIRRPEVIGHYGVRPLLDRFLLAFRRWPVLLLASFFIIASGLFFQRFGVNMVRYHTPVPDCSQVITTDECSAYAPWQRDYLFAQNNTAWERENIITYANMWIHQMVRELYFTVYGAFFPNSTVVDYKTAEPLPFMIILGWTLLISGVIAIVAYLPKLWHDPTLRLFGLMILLYVGILFVQNYKMYVETAVPVAIHGRYLLPVLPLLGVIYFRAYSLLFGSLSIRHKHVATHKDTVLLVGWVVLLFICFQGGGIFTHIVRSNSQWFWQQSSVAQSANEAVRNALRPLIIEEKL